MGLLVISIFGQPRLFITYTPVDQRSKLLLLDKLYIAGYIRHCDRAMPYNSSCSTCLTTLDANEL